MEKLFVEIMEERVRQDAKWGGPAHDAQHDEDDWVMFIVKHARESGPGLEMNPTIFRKQMVRVAALAVAAIEWVDRR